MADLGDVTGTLAALAAAAIYPFGPNGPSITGGFGDVKVFEGWPIPASLDVDIAAQRCQVSVYPTTESSGGVFQLLDKSYVIAPPAHGMTETVTMDGLSSTVAVAGAPGVGEYLTIIADGRNIFSQSGASVGLILEAIAAQAATLYPTVEIVGSSIVFPTNRVIARIGAPATLGSVTHRQKVLVDISIWAPNPQLRNIVARAVDAALKARNRLSMPDTSQAVLASSHSAQDDTRQTLSIYRRSLIFTVEYATLETYLGWEITSITDQLTGGGGAINPNVFTTAG